MRFEKRLHEFLIKNITIHFECYEIIHINMPWNYP